MKGSLPAGALNERKSPRIPIGMVLWGPDSSFRVNNSRSSSVSVFSISSGLIKCPVKWPLPVSFLKFLERQCGSVCKSTYLAIVMANGPSVTQCPPAIGPSSSAISPLPPNPTSGSKTGEDAGSSQSRTQFQYLVNFSQL